jgi:putative ABC transport system permease protein
VGGVSSAGLLSAALEEVSAYRLRAALSVLSIVVGIATLTFIVALGDIGRSATQAIIEREAGRAATLEFSDEGDPQQFAREAMPRIEARLERYQIVARSRVLVSSGSAGFATGSQPVAVYGVDPTLDQVRRIRILAGRWLQWQDSGLLGAIVVPNRAMALEAGLGPSELLGARIPMILGAPGIGLVVGVVDDGQRDGRLYVPGDVLLRAENRSWISRATVIATVDPGVVAAITLRMAADLSRTGNAPLRTERLDAAEDFSSIVTTLQLVLSAIAAISLVSGAIGILNLGLVTVRHRAREFAIRRAFGASRREIFTLVVLESLMTTTLAGMLGIACAALATAAVPLLASSVVDPGDLPPFPIAAGAVGMVVAIGVGLLASAVPALQAMRVSIIETIRS